MSHRANYAYTLFEWAALTLTFYRYLFIHYCAPLFVSHCFGFLPLKMTRNGAMNDKTKTKHVLLECTLLRDLFLALQLEIKLLLALHYGESVSKLLQRNGRA